MSKIYEPSEHEIYEYEQKDLWLVRYMDTDDFHGTAIVFINRDGSYCPLLSPNDGFNYWEPFQNRIDLTKEPMKIVWEKASTDDKEVLDKYAKQVEEELRQDKGCMFVTVWNDTDYETMKKHR